MPGNITVVLTRSYNSAPVATEDKFFLGKNGIATGDVLAIDSDGDNDTLYAVLGSNVSHGTLQLNSDGSFTYSGSGANDSFTYYATDTVGNSASVKVTLSNGLNNLPFLMLLLNNP
ncbi:MAG: Ig-like domain-containing protein [Anaerolineae bacterium]|nr:Ig-like domain-containing protein [Anaerolineae bacterium]